jgi:predicted ATPase
MFQGWQLIWKASATSKVPMSVTALRLLGEYPKGFIGLHHVGLIKNFLAVKRYLKKKSDEDILSLRLMNDPVKESAMAFLATAAYQSYLCHDDIGFLAATLRMLRITFKYGLCGQSGAAFTGYCLVCNNLNDMRGAVRYATVASRILILTKAKELECLQLFVVAHWISAWKEEHSKVLGIYARGHKSGMETGDFDNDLLISTASYHHEFVAGYHLGPIEIKFRNLMAKLRLYKVESIQVMTREQWLVIQHLRGTATSKLDFFAELDKFGPESHQSDETYRLLYVYLGCLQLGVYFGVYKFAERMFLKVAPMSEFYKSHSINSLQLFFGSLTYSTLAKETGKKSYHSKGRKIWKQLKALMNVREQKK